MSKVETAVEHIMELAQAEANPRSMTQAEAAEFYEGLMMAARDWYQTITAEMEQSQ